MLVLAALVRQVVGLLSGSAYRGVADAFHRCHCHDGNVALHAATTALGVWGAVQLALVLGGPRCVAAYAAAVLLTTPAWLGLLNATCLAAAWWQAGSPAAAVLAVVAGYVLQDGAHWLTGEPTLVSTYWRRHPAQLFWHTLWLVPCTAEACGRRRWGLPWFRATRRTLWVEAVASTQSVAELRRWLAASVPSRAATTHLWPHAEAGTAGPTAALEADPAIRAGIHAVYPARHWEVQVVRGMNELYVSAAGAPSTTTSDTVFYTPHVDGPFWWLPGASVLRVLVGLTPNTLVRTRFVHDAAFDRVLDEGQALGFDYNRDLHWIDHTDTPNEQRRALLKLHYVVYPKGWVRYGRTVAWLNERYNAWARGNFQRTLEVASVLAQTNAWWIVSTTRTAALVEQYVGWGNAAFLVAAWWGLDATRFVCATSFYHYALYAATYRWRANVCFGRFVRDAQLFKSVAVAHLAVRLLPAVRLPRDTLPLLLLVGGLGVTALASWRLGTTRTYFGAELGLVRPAWVVGFPYGTLPHPMILGQLVALGALWWGWPAMRGALVATHAALYAAVLAQEMSSR